MKNTRVILVAALAATTLLAARGAHAGPEYKVSTADLERLEPRMQRQVAALQYLMNPYQLRQFFALPSDSSRRAWITRFWAAKDPTPSTPQNEMKAEHYLRADIAALEYHTNAWPGWDRRGEILIRYGFPDYRGKIEAEVTARKIHAPGELWYYRRHQMIVQFADESLNGNYKFAITPFGDAQDMSVDMAEFLIYDTQDAIQERIPPQYLEFYRDPELNDTGVDWGIREELLGVVEPERYLRPRMAGTTEHIDELVDPDYARNLPDNPSDVFQMDRVQKMASNFQAVLEDTPSSYPFNFARETFPFYFGVDQFRGGDGVNRVEINLEFPLKPASGSPPPARSYRASVIVMDENYHIVEKQKQDLGVPTSRTSPDGVRLMPAQIVFTLPRDYYRLGVSMEDLDDRTSAAYRTNVTARNFDSDLAISDVLFAQRIAPAESSTPFMRGALVVVPHPIRRYAAGSAVPVYFELYNLGINRDSVTEYEVEYRVAPHSGKKEGLLDRFRGGDAVFSSSFKASGYSATEPLHITINTENLKPGLYDFMVRVKDEYWQSTVMREASFRIVEPSQPE
ncbi:MAG TPA: GWxTD domain-containing protein [Candidatus Krumholzibacteria bacterium]|nr:GWxTD domain-containing protein [Candidatus Krumholzibacteria bacterium]